MKFKDIEVGMAFKIKGHSTQFGFYRKISNDLTAENCLMIKNKLISELLAPVFQVTSKGLEDELEILPNN